MLWFESWPESILEVVRGWVCSSTRCVWGQHPSLSPVSMGERPLVSLSPRKHCSFMKAAISFLCNRKWAWSSGERGWRFPPGFLSGTQLSAAGCAGGEGIHMTTVDFVGQSFTFVPREMLPSAKVWLKVGIRETFCSVLSPKYFCWKGRKNWPRMVRSCKPCFPCCRQTVVKTFAEWKQIFRLLKCWSFYLCLLINLQ